MTADVTAEMIATFLAAGLPDASRGAERPEFGPMVGPGGETINAAVTTQARSHASSTC
jgi:hypothetical protein